MLRSVNSSIFWIKLAQLRAGSCWATSAAPEVRMAVEAAGASEHSGDGGVGVVSYTSVRELSDCDALRCVSLPNPGLRRQKLLLSDDPRRPPFLIRRFPSEGGVSSRAVQQRAEVHPQILSACDDVVAAPAATDAEVGAADVLDVPDVECDDPDVDDAPASADQSNQLIIIIAQPIHRTHSQD